jgi:hypothetical protein
MSKPRPSLRPLRIANFRLCVVGLALAISFSPWGCKTSAHSSDSRLRKIDEMLDAELPKGTSMARVTFFLSSRGYRIENPGKAQTIVAIVRKIDTETLRPANARVTFHFDAGDRLDSYELAASPDEPPHP